MESEQPYYDNEDYGGRVLWGRVAFFGITLLLAFFLGRCTSDDGAPPEQLELARDRAQDLQNQIEELESQLEEAESDGDGGDEQDEGTETSTDDEAAETDDSNASNSSADTEKTHVVERGETLSELADRYYGNGDKHTLITEANDIDEDNPLQVGQELVIPPDPDA